ncbi:MAG: N-acetyltransferase family protein [Acidimicrobiales bacterium]
MNFLLVLRDANEVGGLTAYESFRGSGKRSGYDRTAEHTIHMSENRWGRGTGRRLLEALIELKDP